jgi:predicted DNA-binding protein (MmcQ/YjbR family)
MTRPKKRGYAVEAIARLREICLALPEATEKPFGGHTAPAFRVREKLFVMTSEPGYSPRPSMQCKAGPGGQDVLVHANPDRYFVPAYTGHNGWVGVYMDGEPDWIVIEELVRESYRLVAPKRLAGLVDG